LGILFWGEDFHSNLNFVCFCLRATQNQCSSCPTHSTLSGTSCTCNTGYLTHIYTCVITCPTGYITSGTACVTDPCYDTNCTACATDNSACSVCTTGLIYKGYCVTACPSNSTLVSGICVDYIVKNALTSKIVTIRKEILMQFIFSFHNFRVNLLILS